MWKNLVGNFLSLYHDKHYQSYGRKAYGPLEDTEILKAMNDSIVFGQFSTTPKLLSMALYTSELQTPISMYSQELP